MNVDKCRKCGENKPINDFPKDKYAKKGYSSYCKLCKREMVKSQYHKNPSKKINKTKNWQKQNPEKHSEYIKKRNNSEEGKSYQKQYYLVNKDKINKYSCDYNKTRYIKSDTIMSPEIRKLVNGYRDRVKRGIKTDRKKTWDLLGCSFNELKQHIENQFYPEMNWENWGDTWEIDHIKGCINFNFDIPSEVEECFHYTNMRPLFKTTSIAESFGYKDIIGNRNRKKIH